MKMFEKANNPPYPKGSNQYDMLKDSRKYATILFETGCRISEVVLLEKDMFTWNDGAVIGWHIPVKKKKGEPEATREVMIKLDERNPLGYDLVEYLETCETKYLLPGLTPFSRAIRPGTHVSIKTAYNRITEMHPDLFPHILRGYRAGMLVNERNFDMRQLMAWFDWKSADMAAHYTKIKDMAASMGITDIPLEQIY